MESLLPPPSKWRVRRAIARKDILTVLLNRGYLVPLIMPILLSLVFKLLFGALNGEEKLVLLVVDPANSSLVTALTELPEVEVRQVASVEALQAALKGDVTGGMVLLPDFDTAVAANQQPQLTIFLNSDSRESHQAALKQIISEQIWQSQYGEPPVWLDWQEYQVGSPAFAAYSTENYLFFTLILLSITMVGVAVLPQMLVEEKEGKMLPALLASPADYADLVWGKAAAALVYTLILALIITLLSQGYTGNWWLTAVATFIVILFTIGLGVLFGLWTPTKGQCHTYSAVLIILLNMPSWFSVVPFGNLSPVVQAFLRLIPTYYYIDTLVQSLNGLVDPAQTGFNLVVLLVSTLIVWRIVRWRLRRVTAVSIQ